MAKLLTVILFLLVTNLGFAQNGKLLIKKLINISETPIWNKVSQKNELKSQIFLTLKITSIHLIVNIKFFKVRLSNKNSPLKP